MRSFFQTSVSAFLHSAFNFQFLTANALKAKAVTAGWRKEQRLHSLPASSLSSSSREKKRKKKETCVSDWHDKTHYHLEGFRWKTYCFLHHWCSKSLEKKCLQPVLGRTKARTNKFGFLHGPGMQGSLFKEVVSPQVGAVFQRQQKR